MVFSFPNYSIRILNQNIINMIFLIYYDISIIFKNGNLINKTYLLSYFNNFEFLPQFYLLLTFCHISNQ